jgi:hypothetical protein
MNEQSMQGEKGMEISIPPHHKVVAPPPIKFRIEGAKKHKGPLCFNLLLKNTKIKTCTFVGVNI